MKYNFKRQLDKGEEQEKILDDFFRSRGWKIIYADMDAQRAGIDRWFEASVHNGLIGIEYKADFRAHETGNLYLETVSVGKYKDGDYVVEKAGWVYTTTADYLMYLIAGEQRVLLFVPDELREFVHNAIHSYRSVSVKNQGYTGRGILVPVEDVRPIIRREFLLTST